MFSFLFVVIGYTVVWFSGMYFILQRLYIIRQRTERRMQDYDSEYIMPVYKKPWILSIMFGIASYVVSLLVIGLFMKP